MTSLEEQPVDDVDVVEAPDVAAAAGNALRCGACAHDLVEHDAIEKRYCDATQAKALPRKCICR